ncbi:MAG: HlyC/CorC family transporter [Phycisphaerales bacterium]|nr:HlyC/CorC family transporter [Phycisphaerales bacterium]
MAIYEIVVILLMVLLNSVFAAYELALASARPERLRSLEQSKRKGARSAVYMKGRMEASLAVVQLGITLFGAIAAAVGGASVDENLSPKVAQWLGIRQSMADFIALALFVIPLAAISIIVGELIPKSFAIKNAERVCLALSPIMRVFGMIAYPIVWLFEYITKLAVGWSEKMMAPAMPDAQMHINELRAQVNMMRAGKIIGMQQEHIILQASRLSAMKVRDIVLPASDIVMMYVEAPLTESLIAAHLDLHTRFPVTERKGDPQAIIGYVNFKEMIFLAKTHPHNPHLREITRPLIRLAADMPVSDALRQMVGEHVPLALVTESGGLVVGMITQEDIFEELVGDIQDEFDRLPRQIIPSGRQWVVGGGATVARLRELTNKPELATGMSPETSVNEWVCKALGRRPKGGDSLRTDGASMIIRKVRRHKVAEVLLDVSGAPLEVLVANADAAAPHVAY